MKYSVGEIHEIELKIAEPIINWESQGNDVMLGYVPGDDNVKYCINFSTRHPFITGPQDWNKWAFSLPNKSRFDLESWTQRGYKTFRADAFNDFCAFDLLEDAKLFAEFYHQAMSDLRQRFERGRDIEWQIQKFPENCFAEGSYNGKIVVYRVSGRNHPPVEFDAHPAWYPRTMEEAREWTSTQSRRTTEILAQYKQRDEERLQRREARRQRRAQRLGALA